MQTYVVWMSMANPRKSNGFTASTEADARRKYDEIKQRPHLRSASITRYFRDDNAGEDVPTQITVIAEYEAENDDC